VQLRFLERWISLLRLVAFPFVLAAVTIASYPHGVWETWAWITTIVFAIGSVVFFVVARSDVGRRHPMAQSIAAELFDTVIVIGYVLVFAFEFGLPVQQILYINLAAASVRFGMTGGTEVARDSVTIAANVQPGLPHIDGDPVRLRQVLTNLIDNAVKYSPEGAPVEIRAAAVNGHVTVDVVDRGRGIDPRDQRVIFERFGRVRGTSKPGTGLGLYIAQAIAEAHGGTLKVSSAVGAGSTFTLELPSR
jgi:anti-sigma regulatory factor (Ser/Thr protein kinase)